VSTTTHHVFIRSCDSHHHHHQSPKSPTVDVSVYCSPPPKWTVTTVLIPSFHSSYRRESIGNSVVPALLWRIVTPLEQNFPINQNPQQQQEQQHCSGVWREVLTGNFDQISESLISSGWKESRREREREKKSRSNEFWRPKVRCGDLGSYGIHGTAGGGVFRQERTNERALGHRWKKPVAPWSSTYTEAPLQSCFIGFASTSSSSSNEQNQQKIKKEVAKVTGKEFVLSIDVLIGDSADEKSLGIVPFAFSLLRQLPPTNLPFKTLSWVRHEPSSRL